MKKEEKLIKIICELNIFVKKSTCKELLNFYQIIRTNKCTACHVTCMCGYGALFLQHIIVVTERNDVTFIVQTTKKI